jgi:hypothetical protein
VAADPDPFGSLEASPVAATTLAPTTDEDADAARQAALAIEPNDFPEEVVTLQDFANAQESLKESHVGDARRDALISGMQMYEERRRREAYDRRVEERSHQQQLEQQRAEESSMLRPWNLVGWGSGSGCGCCGGGGGGELGGGGAQWACWTLVPALATAGRPNCQPRHHPLEGRSELPQIQAPPVSLLLLLLLLLAPPLPPPLIIRKRISLLFKDGGDGDCPCREIE